MATQWSNYGDFKRDANGNLIILKPVFDCFICGNLATIKIITDAGPQYICHDTECLDLLRDTFNFLEE